MIGWIRAAYILGIAVVFPTMLYYTANVFFPRPDIQDYAIPESELENESDKARNLGFNRVITDQSFEEYQIEMNRFAVFVFWIMFPAGVLALTAGTFLRIPAISPGLLFGGLISGAGGFFQSWTYLSDEFKSISLLIILLLLVGFAYYRLTLSTDKPLPESPG